MARNAAEMRLVAHPARSQAGGYRWPNPVLELFQALAKQPGQDGGIGFAPLGPELRQSLERGHFGLVLFPYTRELPCVCETLKRAAQR